MGYEGNTETSGIASPSSPINIDGVGNKTANLFNKATALANKAVSDTTGDLLNMNDLNASDYILVSGMSKISITDTSASRWGAFYDANKEFISGFNGYGTKVIPQNAVYMRITVTDAFLDSCMANEGETLLPFEPYGYKISILKDLSPLTPIYLSQQLMQIGDTTDDYSSSGTATYNIRKLVITGEETGWSQDGTYGSNNRYRLYLSNVKNTGTYITDFYNSHFKVQVGFDAYTSVIWYGGSQYVYMSVPSSDYPTIADFKTWLQQQYAAGTPVTIYYLRATSTTETVTALSIPTTGGEVSIDVDTTVKPSELDLTYHGWHTHEPLKRENGQWE